MKLQINIIGRVGKDAEKILNSNGGAFITFSMASTESWKNKAGEKQEKTTWVKVQKSIKLESTLHEYIKKGDILSVDGSPDAKGFVKKNGEISAEIVINAKDIIFISNNNSNSVNKVEVEQVESEPAF